MTKIANIDQILNADIWLAEHERRRTLMLITDVIHECPDDPILFMILVNLYNKVHNGDIPNPPERQQ